MYRIVYRENSLDDWKPLHGRVKATDPVTGETEFQEMHLFEDRSDAEGFRDRFQRIPNGIKYQIKNVGGESHFD
jgi:uncharacterized protein (DUF885 family)